MDPSPIDLTTIALVKSFLPGANQSSSDDAEIQAIITAVSQYALDFTGRASLKSTATYTEIRDGNGSERMYVASGPIVSLTGVQVNGAALPISTGYNVGGAAIDSSGEAVVIAPASTGTYPASVAGWNAPGVFLRGIRNVQLVYMGGYQTEPADLEEAITRLAAQQYVRRQTVDQQAKSNAAGGGNLNIRYRDWMAEPWVQSVLWKYRRIALVN